MRSNEWRHETAFCPRRQDEDRSIARWGGLAGVGGSILMVVVFAIVGIFAPGSSDVGGSIEQFPELRTVRTVENGLYLAVIVLWVPLALALFHSLRRTNPAAARFGSALNAFGLVVQGAGAIPHVVQTRLSDVYHASGATAGEQATVVLLWEANQGIFEALLLASLLVMPVGVILLGLAMRRDPAYGQVAGYVSVTLGVIGLAAAMVTLIDPRSIVIALGVFALIAFHLLAGWKTYRRAATARKLP